MPNQWIPEDDFLLKNAVEAGASLEALAKGAIQFSRRYTLRELRERWHSLLYDPDISAQASALIFKLELSGFNPWTNLNKSENNFTGHKEISKKRKLESIRRKYYAMRKKFRSEFFNNGDLDFLESNPHEFGGHDDDFQNQVMCDVSNPLVQSCIPAQLGLEEEDLDILRHAFPGPIRGFDENLTPSSREGRINIIKNGKRKANENPCNPISEGFSSFQTIAYASDHTHLLSEDSIISNDVEGKENSSSVYTGEFADPDSLLNLSNDDETLLVDVDGKHVKNNKCSVEITDSIIQVSNKGQENNIAKVEPEVGIHLQASSVLAPSVNSSGSKVDVTSNSDFAKLCHGEICCMLNTEDTEIPCNDDIFLLIHPSTSFGSSPTQRSNTISVSACEKDNRQGINLLPKGKGSAKACLWPQKAGMHSIHPCDGAPKTDSPGFVNKTIGYSSKGRSLYTIPKPCRKSLAEKQEAGVDMKVGDSPSTIIRSMKAGSACTSLPVSLVDELVSKDEESQIDDDVPYFSDIEAMILEMDFDPNDQDNQSIRQVPSYQYDDTKRTIIRLEQASRSCLQRAMTSQQSLALLYGRHLRHYIKKPEFDPLVLLGRSTDDVDVDIDLRKEGRANKVSRRQAIIKMEADGSFFIKNLGKSAVSVNGTTVATGQLLNLSSSCLIEIKGMSFVFEINQGYVRKHLGIFCLKNIGKTSKSDWSAEGES
ncbi:hypothetical protein CASFOL_029417 [Castilleja foliolosa]|uniref:FHA domain-containing protein n=1 Tax=Castilleja foliolosa TaxID=1961234 RepID=A0ABD3CBD7_9LAMI